MKFLDELRQDVRYTLRSLLRNPAFAFVVISILGLGIGASATIFSCVSSLVLRPLKIDDVGSVAQIVEQLPGTPGRQRVAFANFIDWRNQNDTFEHISAFRFENPALAAAGEPERVLSMRVSADIFPLLHARMALGRPFTSEEDRPGAEPVVVLTNAFWRTRFGGDSSIVGRTVRLDGNAATVIGVLADDPDYFGVARIWTPVGDQRLVQIGIDARVIVFVTLTSVLTALAFGLLPALRLSGPIHFSSRHRARNILVVSEVALALVLLAGAGRLVKSYLRVQNVSPGLRTQNVLTMQVAIPQPKYPRNADVSRFYRDVLDGVGNLPGVESAALVQSLPFAGRSNFAPFDVQGAPAGASNENYGLALQQIISPNYLAAADIKLVAGRFFTADGAGAPDVAVINQALAERVWQGATAVGSRIRIGPPEWGLPWLTIVGVTSNVMHYGLDQKVPLEIYVPFEQAPIRDTVLLVNTESDPMALAGTVRRKIFEIDSDQPASAIRPMTQVIDDSLWQRRVLLQLIVVFAGVALALSSVGVYGVISYSMEQRRKEFGIRIALGAQGGNILRLGISEGMKLTAAGVAIGLIAGVIINKRMTALLYGVEATDFTTYCLITALLFSVAFVAVYLPARKALKVDPVNALKVE
jgi:putative ABC transport system permease protein